MALKMPAWLKSSILFALVALVLFVTVGLVGVYSFDQFLTFLGRSGTAQVIFWIGLGIGVISWLGASVIFYTRRESIPSAVVTILGSVLFVFIFVEALGVAIGGREEALWLWFLFGPSVIAFGATYCSAGGAN